MPFVWPLTIFFYCPCNPCFVQLPHIDPQNDENFRPTEDHDIFLSQLSWFSTIRQLVRHLGLVLSGDTSFIQNFDNNSFF